MGLAKVILQEIVSKSWIEKLYIALELQNHPTAFGK